MLTYKYSWIGRGLLIGICIIGVLGAAAQNPILKGYADPHMKVWNGKMYISVGKDKSPEIKGFNMPYWSIYSSSDLLNWQLERDILPEETFMGKGSTRCWATDISARNGKYYFYFSNGGAETGVLMASQPNGPYLDVLRKPLIPEDFSVNHEYDPTIFVDDDGQQYIVFGRDGFDGKNLIHYQMAKLSGDMLSLAEPPRDLMTEAKFGFGAKNRARDHQYFHKHNGTYYLSCAGAYRTSDNIRGPYTNLRQTGQDGGHSSFCAYNGQWYHMYEWTCEPFGNRSYRQVSMTYLHYRDNGDMVDDPDFLQQTASSKEGKYFKTGVGNYDADWEKIEAEWFFRCEGKLLKKESQEGGFEIQNIHDNDYLNFPNFRNLGAKSMIHFRISSANKKGGEIQIRQGSEKGQLLGTCKITDTKSVSDYKTFSCQLMGASDPGNLYFVFKGGKGELMCLDWFNLSN